MSSVTLTNVSLAFPDGTLGLADIDLSIGDGEFVALLGPSGSGKTTLLRTVAGFLAPTGGTVSIGEQVVASASSLLPPERRGLGMVFQQHAVWPHWNVGKNVAYPLKRAGVPRGERARRVAEALDMVGLGGQDRRNPATLSGGQRQRVALARALVAGPQVLLLDEALSALDEPLRDRLRLELRQLAKELGLTVLHVTHDRNEALALADRVVVLDGGRIQQVGAPAELLERPATEFVARFVSDATVIPGRLTAQGFEAEEHPLTLAGHRIRGQAGPGQDVHLTVMPEQVRLIPLPNAGHPDATHGDASHADSAHTDAAVVTSSLFGRQGNDVMVSWGGLMLRSRCGDFRPRVGDRVRVQIEEATAFSRRTDETPSGAQPETAAAALPAPSVPPTGSEHSENGEQPKSRVYAGAHAE